MSLLDEYARKCVILKENKISSDEGGWITEWTDGEEFELYPALNTSPEVMRAEQQGITSNYNMLVKQSVPIAYNDYFRDLTTGQTFRATSDPDEKYTPGSASFSLKFFTAERKIPPT